MLRYSLWMVGYESVEANVTPPSIVYGDGAVLPDCNMYGNGSGNSYGDGYNSGARYSAGVGYPHYP